MLHAKVLNFFEQLAAAQAGTRRKQAQVPRHKAQSNEQKTIPLAQVRQWFERLAALRSRWELCKDKKDRVLATSGHRDDEQNQEVLHESALHELDEEMSLLDENIWQLTDVLRKAIEDDTDQHHIVERTDQELTGGRPPLRAYTARGPAKA